MEAVSTLFIRVKMFSFYMLIYICVCVCVSLYCRSNLSCLNHRELPSMSALYIPKADKLMSSLSFSPQAMMSSLIAS